MGDKQGQLAQLIGSRICHDLISPVGAITNGLELLDLTGTPKGPEFDLISDSVTSASARIRFFRIAFGAAGDQMVNNAEIRTILSDMEKGSRMRTEWSPRDPIARAQVRAAFLALLCLETALPQGGSVTVTLSTLGWTFSAVGEKTVLDPKLWSLLDGQEPDNTLTASQVQFALLPGAASDLGRQVRVLRDENHLTLEI